MQALRSASRLVQNQKEIEHSGDLGKMGDNVKIDFKETGCESLSELIWFRIGSIAVVKF
jgi:hypothetical protein